MAKLPDFTNTIASLMAHRDTEEIVGKPRTYLGMSGIGGECMREQWYGFHWCSEKKHPRRVQRIFERGDWEEQRLIRDLTEIGVECYRLDKIGNRIPITGAPGEKQEEVIGFARHCMGHTDGRCMGVPDAPKAEHLSEFKTANDKNFKLFAKKGVEEAHPTYYGQMQRYMHGLGLTRALFAVTNKNDESRYWERVPYRKDFAEDLERKEQHIVMSDSPLDKIGGPTWFKCKWCDQKEICHHGDAPLQNCRTCDHSDIENEGKWTCSYKEKEISTEEQRAGCEMWKKGWGL